MAAILANPGQADPENVDKITLDEKTVAVPELIIVGGRDSVGGTVKSYNFYKRYHPQGAPWVYLVQNNIPHCWGRPPSLLALHPSTAHRLTVSISTASINAWRPGFARTKSTARLHRGKGTRTSKADDRRSLQVVAEAHMRDETTAPIRTHVAGARADGKEIHILQSRSGCLHTLHNRATTCIDGTAQIPLIKLIRVFPAI